MFLVVLLAVALGVGKMDEPKCERPQLLEANAKWCADHGRVPNASR